MRQCDGASETRVGRPRPNAAHRRKMPPMRPAHDGAADRAALVPPIDLPISAAIWPATLLVTERVTSRATSWPGGQALSARTAGAENAAQHGADPSQHATEPAGGGACSGAAGAWPVA